MKNCVLLVLSDRGWVFEKFAREIIERLPYLTLDAERAPEAPIRYYLNYHAWRERSAPIEVAYFTHLEAGAADQERFFRTARAVDHCVCHSRPSREALHDAGIEDVSTIPPGIDLEQFVPRVRIGVVGRTYHTGRKGEALVQQVLDVPGIDWVFTGSGWPLPAQPVPDEAMPDFYRSLDYLLVPSLNEAGPMSVAEALACGVRVIAPPVGWVPDFPHIEYRTGDASDLRRVLERVVSEKASLRAAVTGLDWDACAARHDRLFAAIAGARGISLDRRASAREAGGQLPAVQLKVHGAEQSSPGGPSTRVPRLGLELTGRGVRTKVSGPGAPTTSRADVVHVFNVWAPETALPTLRSARRLGKSVVFSPILLDLSRRSLWRDALCGMLADVGGPEDIDGAFDRLRSMLQRRAAAPPCLIEPSEGFHASVREMVRLSDAVVALSQAERRRLESIGARHDVTQVIYNPVDDLLATEADPELFARTYGVRDYVLCVGRIEPRKNQLALMQALRETDLPLVLLGHFSDEVYGRLVRRWQWPGLTIVSRLPHGSPLWQSALRGARVFALPSWAEGGPLAALEAAAAGLSLVVSDDEDHREHFEGIARFVDPGDPSVIRKVVLDAHSSLPSRGEREEQSARVLARHSWKRHAGDTLELYREVMRRPASGRRPANQRLDAEAASSRSLAFADNLAGSGVRQPAPDVADHVGPLLFDVTTLANLSGRWTGISRVEFALLRALHDELGDRLTLIAWSNKLARFVPIPALALSADALRAGLQACEVYDLHPGILARGGRLIVCGSAWMQNSAYANGLATLAVTNGIRITAVIHDLIPLRAPYWYPEGYEPIFRANLTRLLGSASSVITVSRATQQDLLAAKATLGLLDTPPSAVFRLGDALPEPAGEPDPAMCDLVQDSPFVLCVGAIHSRKNYQLLYRVWLRLAERMGDNCPKLIIVGGRAWNGIEVDGAFRLDERIAHLVHNSADVDDATLEWLYRHARLTVYPSLDEGWGLPVAESLRYGVPCLAAAIPSVSEIAPGVLETLDPDDPVRWATRIEYYTVSTAARADYATRIASVYAPTDWSTSARELMSHVVALASQEAPASETYDVCSLGSIISLTTPAPPGLRFVDGWSAPGPDGRRLSRTGGLLVLSLEPGLQGDLLIAVEFATERHPPWRAVAIRNGDRTLSTWPLRRGALSRHYAVVPNGAEARSLTLYLQPLEKARPSRTRHGADDLEGVTLRRVSVSRLADVGTIAAVLPGPSAAEPFRPGGWYDVRRASVARSLLGVEGLTDPLWGVVPSSRPARLSLAVHCDLASALELEVAIRADASPTRPVAVSVLANAHQLGSFLVHAGHPMRLRAPLPLDLRRAMDPLVIDVFASALDEIPGAPGQPLVGLLAVRVLSPDSGAPLAVSWKRYEAEPMAPDFGPADGALGPEWSVTPAGLAWEGPHAVLPVYVGRHSRRGLRLSMRLRDLATASDGPAWTASVTVGDTCLAILPVGNETSGDLAFFVPSVLSDSDGIVGLVFRLTPTGVRQDGSDEAHKPSIELTGLRAVAEEGLVLLSDQEQDGSQVPLKAALAETHGPEGMYAGPLTHKKRSDSSQVVHIDMRAANHRIRAKSIGLYRPNEEGSWTDAAFCRLTLPAPGTDSRRLRILALSRVFGTSTTGPAHVELRVEDEHRGTWLFDDDGWCWKRIDVELPAGHDAREIRLDLIRPGAIAPTDVGESGDPRALGVYLRTILLAPLRDGR